MNAHNLDPDTWRNVQYSHGTVKYVNNDRASELLFLV